MLALYHVLMQDEAGFVVSAELILVATLLVIGLIVGLSEVQHAVVSELNDVADAVGSLNQSYSFTGFSSIGHKGKVKSRTFGSRFQDLVDSCDQNQCDLGCDAPVAEGRKGGHHYW